MELQPGLHLRKVQAPTHARSCLLLLPLLLLLTKTCRSHGRCYLVIAKSVKVPAASVIPSARSKMLNCTQVGGQHSST